MGSLEGRVALATGADGGLGRSIVRALAAQDAAVAVHDVFRDEAGVSAAEATAREVEAADGKALPLLEDVTTSVGAQAMVDQTVCRFGHLDILVCCTDNMIRGLLHELTEQRWDLPLNLHLKGHFLSCKMTLPHMPEQDFGWILTVTSRGASFQAPAGKRDAKDVRKPPSMPYSVAKAGILGLTTTLAIETWDIVINVNCLLPSATMQLFPKTRPRMASGVPACESLDPDDVAPAAEFL